MDVAIDAARDAGGDVAADAVPDVAMDVAMDVADDADDAEAGSDAATSTTVGPAGGEVAGDGVTLEAPPGAVSTPVAIAISIESGDAPPGYVADTPVFRFGPDGLTFAVPVTVRFTVATHGADDVVYWSNAAGSGYDALTTTWSGSVASAEVTHFSGGFVGAASRDAGQGTDADVDGDVGGDPHDAGPADVGSSIDGSADARDGDTDAQNDAAEDADADVGAVDAGVDPSTLNCGTPMTCVSDPSDPSTRYFTCCGAQCLDLGTNHDNCGSCGLVCAPNNACRSGSCQAAPADAGPDADAGAELDASTEAGADAAPGCGSSPACVAPMVCCATHCADLQTDQNNCGYCGNACIAGQVCQHGNCLRAISDAGPG